MEITRTSIHSGITRTLTLDVTAEEIATWKAGELIQNALPELSDEERELLISKTCDSCWNKLFPEDFDE